MVELESKIDALSDPATAVAPDCCVVLDRVTALGHPGVSMAHGTCGGEYTQVGEGCYSLHGVDEVDMKTWEEASTDCKGKSGYLARVGNMGEWEAIRDYIEDFFDNTDHDQWIWMGAKSANGSLWQMRWESGDQVSLPGLGFSNNGHCLNVKPRDSKPLMSNNCSYRKPYMCEFSKLK